MHHCTSQIESPIPMSKISSLFLFTLALPFLACNLATTDDSATEGALDVDSKADQSNLSLCKNECEEHRNSEEQCFTLNACNEYCTENAAALDTLEDFNTCVSKSLCYVTLEACMESLTTYTLEGKGISAFYDLPVFGYVTDIDDKIVWAETKSQEGSFTLTWKARLGDNQKVSYFVDSDESQTCNTNDIVGSANFEGTHLATVERMDAEIVTSEQRGSSCQNLIYTLNGSEFGAYHDSPVYGMITNKEGKMVWSEAKTELGEFSLSWTEELGADKSIYYIVDKDNSKSCTTDDIAGLATIKGSVTEVTKASTKRVKVNNVIETDYSTGCPSFEVLSQN